MAADLKTVLQKYKDRSLQDDDLEPEDKDVFLVSAQKCLENGEDDSEMLLREVSNKANEGFIREVGWDLLPVVTPFLTAGKAADTVQQHCRGVLGVLAEVCKPKEFVLGILEKLEGLEDDNVFKSLLPPLQRVLQRLSGKRAHCIGLTLTTLHSHLTEVPLPSKKKPQDPEDESWRQFGVDTQDKHVGRLLDTTEALMEFVQPFVQMAKKDPNVEAAMNKDELKDLEILRKELVKFLTRLFKYPLVYLNLEELPVKEDENKTQEMEGTEDNTQEVQQNRCRLCAATCMSYLQVLDPSFSRLLDLCDHYCGPPDMRVKRKTKSADKQQQQDGEDEEEKTEEEDDGKEEASLLGLCCFSYLLLVENIFIDKMPAVLSHEFLGAIHIVLICEVLKKPHRPVIHKGLELTKTLLGNLEPFCLSYEILELQPFAVLPESLIHVMVQCPTKSLRKLAHDLLTAYVDKFDWRGRYMLLRGLMEKTGGHAGVMGLIVGKVKDQIDACLKDDPPSEWFTGNKLSELLRKILHLPDGATTDLLDNRDWIMPALNLLRYLVIRDKPDQNQTGVWTDWPEVEKGFLRQLRTGVNLSKSHFQEELKKTRLKHKNAKKPEVQVSIEVAGDKMPDMPYEQQIMVLESSMQMFSVIESLLGRITEVTETYRTGEKPQGKIYKRETDWKCSDLHAAEDDPNAVYMTCPCCGEKTKMPDGFTPPKPGEELKQFDIELGPPDDDLKYF
ncbi:glomulin-like [Branchiostoma floridae]|uniref:Glomulin-like n=1 Tax=Branchiostoma floridae TaxID=7739 RepID=A0A9J7LML0_BRAFL|nr:glomulin-like [Branchiostoma floridae]